ncbi:MAG TPA: hypothetical protein RMH99_29855 [Sandaracinaceae bacterium LLY-WYZ-13_1]|nr:hypothetical protein [Sandaracinaceae bacterium LLY-WYZ-13_1]
MSSQSNPINRHRRGLGAASAACVVASLLVLGASSTAEAQIGPARRVSGAPVAAEAVHARFVWGAGGNRIIFVNQADEVYYHRVRGNSVQRHIRMRGHTVGHQGDPTEYVVPWGNNDILVVTQRGSLYKHHIRGESIGPPEQIQGAPVGTQGQDPIFMFRVGNRLINVTRQGEVWAHQIGRVVSPPQRLGRVAIAAPRRVTHVFNIGRTVYVVSDQGEVYAHDVHPNFGRGRLLRSRSQVLGRDDTNFVFVMGRGLYAVNERGQLFVHDISRLRQGRRGVRGQHRQQSSD